MPLPALVTVTAWPRSIRILLFSSLVDSVGTALFVTVSVLYLARIRHMSASEIGVILSVASLIGVLATLPLTTVVSRLSDSPALALLNTLQGFLLFLYPCAHAAWQLCLVTSVLAILEGPTGPLRRSLYATRAGDNVGKARALSRTLVNVGLSVGTALATIPAAAGKESAYLSVIYADAVSYVAVGGLVMLMGEHRAPGAPSTKAQRRTRTTSRLLHQPRFVALASANAILSFHSTILEVGLPLWLLRTGRVSLGWIGPLTLINTVLAVLLTYPVSVRMGGPSGSARLLAMGGASLGIAGLLLLGSDSFRGTWYLMFLALSVLALTFAEIAQGVASWEFSTVLLSADANAEGYAVFGFPQGLLRTVGPLLVVVILYAKYGIGWLCLLAAIVSAIFVVLRLSPESACGHEGIAGAV